jgi:hypothetical protein
MSCLPRSAARMRSAPAVSLCSPDLDSRIYKGRKLALHLHSLKSETSGHVDIDNINSGQ